MNAVAGYIRGGPFATHPREIPMAGVVSTAKLRLASHVRACDCGRNVILLDLRRGRYLGVSEATSRALAGHVDGWPTRNEAVEDAASLDALSGAARSLVSQGLLTDRPIATPPTINLDAATASIDAETTPGSRTFGSRRFLQFTSSVAVAAWCLRFRSLLTIASSIAARHELLLTPEAESIEAMRPAIGAYEALRPFVFTVRDKCLLDSLSLVTFLAKDGLLARWVIGIKTSPFGAHSWVQSGQTVLNDQHEYVRQFHPILVV